MAQDDGTTSDQGRDVVARAAELGLLRPTLELAVLVARAGSDGQPQVPPPASLRPLLRHSKLTARSMVRVARVIEEDGEFRQRVVEAAEQLGPEALSELARRWLTHAEGWPEDLAEAVGLAEAATERRREEREERQARRLVVELTAELDGQRRQVEAAGQRAAAAEAELSQHRQERRELVARVQELSSALAASRTEADRWRSAAEVAQRSESAAALSRRDGEAELARARRGRAELEEQVAQLEAALIEARDERDAERAGAQAVASSVGLAVADAAAAAQALGAALETAARFLADRPPPARSQLLGEPPGAGDGQPAPAADRGEPAIARSGRARRPLPLPPAVFEDSPEAATHLVRPGVLLLVDGYNVSLFAWPELALPAQRHRVTTALAELAARSGATVQVVFDGDEHFELPGARGALRAPVRVVFSSPGVDADEVIIDLVDERPAEQAVVVATNDRRVQEEVRRRGANVLTTPQLLGLLRRSGPRD